MRDRSKQLLVINTGKKGSGQNGLPSQSGPTHIIGGGGLSANMAGYLLKSIWDKVFEIRTDSQGTEYIFGKLPVVTQYGVTMYAEDKKLNIPSIYDGLPIDWNTLIRDEDGVLKVNPNIKLGGASSWDELEGKPDLSVYAKSSDVTAISSKLNDFLEGSDTDNIINKWKELESFLSGLSESDNLATILLTKADKTYVDDTFVTLATSQTITGEKNFTGGLKVNGSPIYYDTSKKYWKLEGDLLVTGGVTMYGNDSSFNPSTIMDAIAVDGTTISKSGGVLKVIGGVGASTMGSLSNVGTWADSVADADRIMYQAAGSSSWIAKPLSSISASGDYLPLSGGTVNGNIQLGNDNNTSYYAMLVKQNGNVMSVGLDYGYGTLGYRESGTTNWNLLSVKNNDILCSFNGGNNWNTLIHSGNIGEYTIRYYGNQGAIDFDNVLYNGVQYTSGSSVNGGKHYGALMSLWVGDTAWQIVGGRANEGLMYRSGNGTSTSWSAWKIIAFTDSNVASATKLQTARTIWGQSFDGTGNITGSIISNTTKSKYVVNHNVYYAGNELFASDLTDGDELGLYIGQSYNAKKTGYIAYHRSADDNSSYLTMGLHSVDHVFNINTQANVGIGTTNPSYKLDVNGKIAATKANSNSVQLIPDADLGLFMKTSGQWIHIAGSGSDMFIYNGEWDNFGKGNYAQGIVINTSNFVGIGTRSPLDKLHVAGNLRLKDDSNYGRTIYFGDGEYCYLREASDDQLTIHANQGLIIADKTTINSNLLVSGGITMYSMRALKNVVDERGLSLSELSVIKPTRYTWKDGRDNRLHFGGIADDIQQVLPEVVYKTSEGILTLDYGNAAFAIASSLIKPIIDHEKRIAMLEEENKQLRQEVERLKSV